MPLLRGCSETKGEKMNASPNILLITTDEQRFDTYGAPHSDWPQLPNLSRLRREGTTFTHAYSNCPICMPCRYTWITGLYGSQTERGAANGYDWPDYHKTMPQALQKAGYHTVLIGKLHAFTVGTLGRYHLNELEKHSHVWGYDTVCECSGRAIWSHELKREEGQYGIRGCRYTDHLRSRGLCEKALRENIERDQSERANAGLEPYRAGVLDVDDTMDGFIVKEMRNFVRTYHGAKPFFLHASFFAPHYPLDVPQDYFGRFRPEDMPPPIGLSDTGLIRRWQENRAMYMALASLVDDQIGRLLETLEERDILDDTVILFTTDHGDMLGDHGLHHKFHPHEGSSRTPIIVRRPDLVPGAVTLPGLVESADLPHTILEIAGLSSEERMASLPESPGRSFWEYCRQGGERFRESALSETRGHSRMLRCGDWKYTRTPGRSGCLYNLAEDPCELVNRADSRECSKDLRRMEEMLIDRMASIRIPPIQGKFRGEEIIRQIRKEA